LQLFEFNEVFINIVDSRFYASCFCTVGLHFIHVLMGVIGLLMVLCLGVLSAGVVSGIILSLLYVADSELRFRCVMDLTKDSFFT
uniref:Cytochrome c oxidase subunit 3 n=1 Tax=Schistocephalus solidus TaxID=70667 RepID=A0A183SA06_SCHSO